MLNNWTFTQFYTEGAEACNVRTRKSAGGILNMVELSRPPGDLCVPALPELVLVQDITGGTRTSGNAGSGHFNVISEFGAFYLPAPDFAHTIAIDGSNQIRSLSFSLTQWQNVLDEASEGRFSVDSLQASRGFFHSPVIRSAVQNLWFLCEEEGVPSRLLVRAAGCEILAEICALRGAAFAPVNGGLSPAAKRRCIEVMHARLSEDLSLDELAAETGLSVFHSARMFKQTVGVPPRVYLTQMRMEKASELLRLTELSIAQIAQEVGYSSGQVLARIFFKHHHRSPTDYRRVVAASARERGTGSVPGLPG